MPRSFPTRKFPYVYTQCTGGNHPPRFPSFLLILMCANQITNSIHWNQNKIKKRKTNSRCIKPLRNEWLYRKNCAPFFHHLIHWNHLRQYDKEMLLLEQDFDSIFCLFSIRFSSSVTQQQFFCRLRSRCDPHAWARHHQQQHVMSDKITLYKRICFRRRYIFNSICSPHK